MKTILCVEDELHILENNRKALADNGYSVLTAASLFEARQHLSVQTPDAIILDIMLPDGLGLDLLKELRAEGNKIPVLMLTAWGKPADVERGLRAGANDYLSKPFDYGVLIARIDAMFRNVEQMPETVVKGALRLNIPAMMAYIGGEDMLLTQKEFALLLLFTQNEGRTISAEYLYEKLWDQPMTANNQAVRTAVSRLRKKLKGSGLTIFPNSQNEGYCFEDENKL